MKKSIKNLKKEINYIFGEIIDEANYKQLNNPEIADESVEAISTNLLLLTRFLYQNSQRQKSGKQKSLLQTTQCRN